MWKCWKRAEAEREPALLRGWAVSRKSVHSPAHSGRAKSTSWTPGASITITMPGAVIRTPKWSISWVAPCAAADQDESGAFLVTHRQSVQIITSQVPLTYST